MRLTLGPTLRVGMQARTFRVFGSLTRQDDAACRGRHSHAERGNECFNVSSKKDENDQEMLASDP